MKTGVVKSRPSRLIYNSTFKLKPNEWENEWENTYGKKYVRALLNQQLLWMQLSHIQFNSVQLSHIKSNWSHRYFQSLWSMDNMPFFLMNPVNVLFLQETTKNVQEN